MDKAFVYGMSVEGSNFTDRIHETARLKKRISYVPFARALTRDSVQER